MPRTVLAVVTEPGSSTPGGTFVLQERLKTATGMSVLMLTENEVLDHLRATPLPDRWVVFTQQEGSLNPAYRTWAEAVLDAGAHLVELNVFNLPSRWRPVHPAYVMAVLSEDGLARYRMRSWATAGGSTQRALILPNIISSVETRKWTERSRELRLLRLGRPDPIKWSSWEVDYAARLAQARPHTPVRLTLVGSPPGITETRPIPNNLRVVVDPFVHTVSEHYAMHVVYVHFSRIGETFGNTVAEAQEAGLFVVLAADPRWDCAPATFLDREVSLVGTRGWLARNIEHSWERISAFLQSPGTTENPHIGATPAKYAETLGSPDGEVQPMPSLMEAATSISRTCRSIQGVPLGAVAPAWELARGLLWAVRSARGGGGSHG